MPYFIFSISCSVVPVNFLLLTITLHSLVITSLVYNDTKYSCPLHDYIIEFDCIFSIILIAV